MRTNYIHNGQDRQVEGSYTRHPVQDIEPLLEIDPVRSIQVRFLQILGNAFGELQGPLEAGDLRRVRVLFYGIAMSLGLPCVTNITMTKAAAMAGCSKALISHYAIAFANLNGLPPSPAMKSAGAGDAYRDARNTHLEVAWMDSEQLIQHYEDLGPQEQIRFLKNADYKKRLKNAIAEQKQLSEK